MRERARSSALDPSLTWAIREGRITYHEAMAIGARPQDILNSDLRPSELRRAGASDRELVVCGFDPIELFEEGGSPTLLQEVDTERLQEVNPESLAEAATEEIDPSSITDSVESVVDALPVAPTQLARTGASVAEAAGYNVPVDEIIRAGYLATELLDTVSEVASVLDGGAPPSVLSDFDVDISTLESVDLPAGSLRLADIPAEALLEAGYDSAELLRGGFDSEDVLAAGGAIEDEIREVADLVDAGRYTPSQLRSLGVGPDTLYERNLDPVQLLAGGYSEGELLDADVPVRELVEAGGDVGALRAAGVPVDELADAGASPAALANGGASPDQLLKAGVEEARVAAAGYAEEELENAGIDPDLVEEAAREVADVTGLHDKVVEGIPMPRNEQELYDFPFDPASSRSTQTRGPPSTDGGHYQGADVDVAGDVPFQAFWSIDSAIESWLDRLTDVYDPAAAEAASVQDQEGVMEALERESLSAKAQLIDSLELGTAVNSDIKALLEMILPEVPDVTDPEAFPRVALSDPVRDGMHVEDETFVDEDIDRFLSILEAESLEDLQYLTYRFPEGSAEIAPGLTSDNLLEDLYDAIESALPVEEILGYRPSTTEAKRRACYLVLEEFESEHRMDANHRSFDSWWNPQDDGIYAAAAVLSQLVDNGIQFRSIQVSNNPLRQKYLFTGQIASEYGDSGLPRSLGRMLFYQATVQAYLNGRLRLGAEYDDLSDLRAEFDDPAPLDRLFQDSIPSSLRDRYLELEAGLQVDLRQETASNVESISRTDLDQTFEQEPDIDPQDLGDPDDPNFDPSTDGGEEIMSYQEVLAAAAVEESATTSLAPELSEFTDSLAALAERDSETIETLVGETLDTTSHRVDAWWTSLGTKRLFELRDDQSEPGLYVGGYGVVEDLSPTDEEEIEYVHTPSLQQAKTAGVLRGGYQTGLEKYENEAEDNPLAVDLSPERVRDAKWLIRGVRRGQSLGELLGTRFERRLHELTLSDTADVMKYRPALREAFPGVVDSLEYLDDEDADIDERREVAKSDVVNGYRLVRNWDDYPFPKRLDGEEEVNLPTKGDEDADARNGEWGALNEVVDELAEDLDAVSDLLLAEGIHQLGQRNTASASGSLDALASGESLPDPDLVEVPRSETGITHRLNVLLGTDQDAGGTGRLRRVGEPAVNAWLEELLPARDRVGFTATFRYQDDGQTETESHDVTLAELAVSDIEETRFSALDIVALGRDPEGEGGSELASWLAYHCRRHRPDDVPADADLDLDLGASGEGADVSVSALLETARSLRSLLSEARPLTGEDLTHPSDPMGAGWIPEDADGPGTVEQLTQRADTVEQQLQDLRDDLGDALDVFDPETDEGKPVEDPIWETIETVSEAVAEIDRDLLAQAEEAVSALGSGGTLDSALDSFSDEQLVGSILEPDEATETFAAESNESLRIRVDDPTDDGDDEESDESSTDDDGSDDGGDDGSDDAGDDGSDDAGGEESEEGDEDGADSGGARDWLRDQIPGDSDGEDGIIQPPEPVSEATQQVRDLTVQPTGSGSESESEEDSEPADEEESALVETTVTATVLGLEGTAPFVDEPPVDLQDGIATVTLDLSGYEEGTAVTVIVEVRTGEEVHDRAVRHGYVGQPWTEAGIDTDTLAEEVRALAWLVSVGDKLLSKERLPALAGALGSLSGEDWAAIDETHSKGYDSSSPVLESADEDALDELLDLEYADVSAAVDGLRTLVAFGRAIGLDELLDVIDRKEGYEGARFRDPESPRQGIYRTRLEQLSSGTPSNLPTVPAELLQFAPDAVYRVTTADELDEDVVAAEISDALTAQLPPSSASLAELADEGVGLDDVAVLHRWAYDPGSLSDDDRSDLEGALEAVDDTALSALETTVDLSDDSLTSLLGELDAIDDHGYDDRETVLDAAFTDFEAGEIDDDTLSSGLESVVAGRPVAVAFRRVALERLRGPLVKAATAGVYGAVPAAPARASPADVRGVAEAARGVRATIQRRIETAESIDPSGGSTLEERVNLAREQLEALFDDEFTAYPPFVPPNHPELQASFEDNRLLDGLGPMAVETWFQRVAQVKSGPDRLRESLSYGEALSEPYVRELSVAQLPYRSQEAEGEYTWIGGDGVTPEPGRVSIATEFGTGASPETFEAGIAGIAVDEWVQKVPDDTVTTGVAIGADEPTNRPPQTMLLATPPKTGDWSLGGLVEAITETMTYADYRAVDQADLEAISGLVPTVSLPSHPDNYTNRSSPRAASLDPDILEWAVPWEPHQFVTITMGDVEVVERDSE